MNRSRRIGLLAPMDIELAPLVRDLELIEVLPNEWRGNVRGVEIVGVRSDIGMEPARSATQTLLDFGVDHVMVVGIAGAVAPTTEIGTVIAPVSVIDRASGLAYVPSRFASPEPFGAITCGDDLITDPDELLVLEHDEVIALDMESAAVGAVCSHSGVAWSVWRAISDHAGGGLIDDDLLAMTKPDGSGDPEAVRRALADPHRRARLEQLARDANRAVEAAAAAAVSAIAAL